MGGGTREFLELRLSQQSQVGPLAELLSLGVPDVQLSRIAGQPQDGELGALDVLEVVVTSSSMVAAIKILPEFLRSRKTGLSITMTVKGEPFTLTATNVDEVMPILQRLLDD